MMSSRSIGIDVSRRTRLLHGCSALLLPFVITGLVFGGLPVSRSAAQPPAPAPVPTPPSPPQAPPAGEPPPPAGPAREFEIGTDYRPLGANARVTFNIEDADLPDLVRLISGLTGYRFIMPGRSRTIRASIFAPTRVTVQEAYNAFLSVLEANGMTVVPSGRYLRIVDSQGADNLPIPINPGTAPTPGNDRYYTRLHYLSNVSADDVAQLLTRFKSRDGNITAYAPTNLLILTDTGAQIQRMLRILEAIDVPRTGEQIWIEPIHYADADELAQKLAEIFDTEGGSASQTPRPAAQPGQAAAQSGGGESAGGSRGSGEMRIRKILADERTNSLIILATERAYTRILDMVRQLDVPLEGEGRIHVHYVQHGNAEDIATTLSSLVGGGSSGGGGGSGGAPGAAPGASAAGAANATPGIFEGAIRVTAHEPTNALVITSSLHDYAALRNVIEQLDAPRRQVFIEAVVMELTVSRSNRLGFSFHGGIPNFPTDDSISILGFNAQGSLSPVNQNTLSSMAVGVRGPTIPESQQLLGFSIPAFGVVLEALATTGDVNVLSTPHIIAMDNVEAEITVGENIPLQTNSNLGSLTGLAGLGGATGSTATSAAGLAGLAGLSGLGGMGGVQRQDVGTTIRVTPHINDANEVRLEIEEEISERGATEGALGVVSISKRKAKTEVMVRDQQTVVLGGLMRETTSNSQTKVPILGDIPVLGALFRRTTRETRKTNLLLILTPYIIRDPGDLRTIFERKMRERQEFIDRYFVFGDTDYEPPVDWNRTRGFVAEMFAEIDSLEEEALLAQQAQSTPPPAHVARPPVGAGAAADANEDIVIEPTDFNPSTTPLDTAPPSPEPEPAAPTPRPTGAPRRRTPAGGR